MLSWFRVAVLFVVALSACGDKAADAPPAPVPPPSPPIANPSPAAEPEPPAATIPEATVKELVSAWLAAQNQGDFEAYAALYAAKFLGVKRAGQRETRFDRAGWLKDRERMFAKPMTVEAREPRIRTTSASADVELTQHWTSGKFEDSGPKRLLIVREAGKLKIAQEEMLRSDVAAA
jgi:ketosteroid isomerase-like protein